MEYLDFGTPISFGYTAQYLDHKTQTRRQWKDGHAEKFCKAFDRAEAVDKQLRVPAVDKGYHAGGRQIGHCIITLRPQKESLSAMGYGDLVAEGGMCSTTEEFIQKYFEGNTSTEVWAISFVFVPLPDLELEFTPFSERQLYIDMATRLAFEVAEEPSEGTEIEDDLAAKELDLVDWLNNDLAEQIGIAEFRLQELEIDREALPEDIYVRQRLEWRTKLECWRYTERAIAKINTRFTPEYEEIVNREHPAIETEPDYTPDFAVNKLVESSPETGNLLVRIDQYHHTAAGWIAKCNVRISRRVTRGSEFLIAADELFKDFHPWVYVKREILPQYSLGSIRTVKGLKNHFPGLKLPAIPRPDSTEVKAPDGSIWQACKDGWSERAAVKWRCEVLPDGFSRSPRIDSTKKTTA